MPNWSEILNEVKKIGHTTDLVRRKYLVPQIAMSGGSMIACACKEILMGLNSNIGPFDPQIGGMPAQAIKSEFDRAAKEIRADQTKGFIWQPILGKLNWTARRARVRPCPCCASPPG